MPKLLLMNAPPPTSTVLAGQDTVAVAPELAAVGPETSAFLTPMRVGLVKRSPDLSFSAFSLPFARGGPELGSWWSARCEARTNDLVRRRGRPQSVFGEKALGQRSWSRKHPFGPPVA